MHIYIRELKASWKVLLFISLGIIVFLVAGMSEYSVIAGGEGDSVAIWDGIDPRVLAVFGVQNLDLSNAAGYYGFCCIYLIMVFAFYGMLSAINTFVSEEKNKTAEFIYTKPISRKSIFIQKVLVTISKMLILVVVAIIASIFIVYSFTKNYDLNYGILRASFVLIIIGLVFSSIGFFIASIIKNAKKAARIGQAIVLGTYVLGILINIINEISFLKILSPYNFYEINKVIDGDIGNLLYYFWAIFLTAAFIFISLIYYMKKDIKN